MGWGAVQAPPAGVASSLASPPQPQIKLKPAILVHHLDTVFLRVLQLCCPRPGPPPRYRSWPRPSPTPSRPGFRRAPWLPWRVIFSRVPVKTTVFPDTGDDLAGAAMSSTVSHSSSRFHRLHIVRLVEEIMDGFGHHPADAFDMLQFLQRVLGLHAVEENIDIAIAPRQQPRGGFADMADAQRIDETVQPDGAAALDRRHQVFDHLVFAFLFPWRLS